MEEDPYEQAKILEAGKHATTHDPTNPTWRHRRVGEKIESRVFPANKIPDGWYETAALIPEREATPEVTFPESEAIPDPPKRGPGRPRKKVSDVDNG